MKKNINKKQSVNNVVANNSKKRSNHKSNTLRVEGSKTTINGGACVCMQSDVIITTGDVRVELDLDMKDLTKVHMAVVGGSSQIAMKEGSFEKVPQLYREILKADQEDMAWFANGVAKAVVRQVNYIKEQVAEAPDFINNLAACAMQVAIKDREIREVRKANEPEYTEPTANERYSSQLEEETAHEQYNTDYRKMVNEQEEARERNRQEHYVALKNIEQEFEDVK